MFFVVLAYIRFWEISKILVNVLPYIRVYVVAQHCRGVLGFDVRASVRLFVRWCHAHLDADPDLDASTNRVFRDVRDVGHHSFS